MKKALIKKDMENQMGMVILSICVAILVFFLLVWAFMAAFNASIPKMSSAHPLTYGNAIAFVVFVVLLGMFFFSTLTSAVASSTPMLS